MSNKKIIGVIPARLNSTRLPKKILASINNLPMVIHTAQQASLSSLLNEVIIAIDDEETYESINKFGFRTILTSKSHQSGTDRIAEAVKKLSTDFDVVVNIQADEPFIDPSAIDLLVKSFDDPLVSISTIVNSFLDKENINNKNVVKALLDEDNWAIDFKRTIEISDLDKKIYKHMGIYGYLKDTLDKFVSFPRSIREEQRSLEQMRALDNNIPIKAIIVTTDSLSIDTEEDYLNALKEVK